MTTKTAVGKMSQSFLAQPWLSAMQELNLLVFMGREANGPFLRPLCKRWRQLGSPQLLCVRSIAEMSAANSFGKADINLLATTDLAQLSCQQENEILQMLRFSVQSTDSRWLIKPFDYFALQLARFSAIKAELLAFERKSLGAWAQDVENVSARHLIEFEKKREARCDGPNDHRYLGFLIWGEHD